MPRHRHGISSRPESAPWVSDSVHVFPPLREYRSRATASFLPPPGHFSLSGSHTSAALSPHRRTTVSDVCWATVCSKHKGSHSHSRPFRQAVSLRGQRNSRRAKSAPDATRMSSVAPRDACTSLSYRLTTALRWEPFSRHGCLPLPLRCVRFSFPAKPPTLLLCLLHSRASLPRSGRPLLIYRWCPASDDVLGKSRTSYPVLPFRQAHPDCPVKEYAAKVRRNIFPDRIDIVVRYL